VLASGTSGPYGIIADASNVYWTDSTAVKKAPIAVGTTTTLASGLTSPNYIAVDATNAYFTDWSDGTVKKVNLSNLVSTTLASGLTNPNNIAADSTYVYWTENAGGTAGSGTVKRVPLSSTGTTAPTVVASGLNSPSGMAVDGTSSTVSSYVYFTEYTSSGTLKKVSAAGGTPTTLASGLNWPYDVAIDSTYAYWTETGTIGSGTGAVKKITLTGTGLTTLASGLADPYDIDVDATNVYWIQAPSGGGSVKAVSINGGTPATIAQTSNPGDITIDATNVYWTDIASNAVMKALKSSSTGSSPLTLLGSFAYSGVTVGDMAVNPSTQQVYISSGMGGSGLIRINASNPASMSQTTLSYGGGVAVDKTTGRYATTSGSTLYVFNSNDTLYDSQTLIGCGGDLDADPATGRFFISTQCTDHIAVYNESSKTFLANIANNGVGSVVVFDPGVGNIFENLTPNNSQSQNAPLVVSSSYGTSLPFTGFVKTADGVLKHLYVADNSNPSNLLVLDGTTFATLHTFTGLGSSYIAADTALGRFYAVTSGNTLTTYDANTYTQIGTPLTIPGSIIYVRMAPGDNRLYAISTTTLYVYQR
jgi:hypothetical protein